MAAMMLVSFHTRVDNTLCIRWSGATSIQPWSYLVQGEKIENYTRVRLFDNLADTLGNVSFPQGPAQGRAGTKPCRKAE